VSAVDDGKVLPLYLLWGEEFLVRTDAEELQKKLVPDAAAGINLVTLDGATPTELALELSTMPLFPGRKVVVTHDPEFMAPKKGRADGLAKAKDAWRAGRRKEGARRLLALAARAGWGPSQLDPTQDGAPSASQWREALGVELADADFAFLKEVAAYCQDAGLLAPESDAAVLLGLFKKGLPEGHVLLVAATELDPKHPLFKLAQEEGRVVERKVTGRLKDLDVSGVARELLEPYQKRLGRGAEEALKDRVGGNMRLLKSELEKLVAYSDNAVIERADVEAVVARSREEEFLELSDALLKRDLPFALRYVEDALGQGSAPLMLLGAITSILRGLLESYELFRHVAHGRAPRSLDDFKRTVFPAIEEEAKAKKEKAPHPYAAFLRMQGAARFTREELRRAWLACADADLGLKSSANGKLTLERLLLDVCGAGGRVIDAGRR
jgi:DNA polymerase-3 subunit delta